MSSFLAMSRAMPTIMNSSGSVPVFSNALLSFSIDRYGVTSFDRVPSPSDRGGA